MRGGTGSGLWLSGLAALSAMSALAAETGAAETAELVTSSEPPRRVGWFLGDRLAWHGRIVAPEGFELDPASLPQPGPIDNFTEIGSIAVEDDEAAGARVYDITILYQSFYVPLEPREVPVPALSVELRRVSPEAGEPERREASFDGWSVVLSPLRPILEKSSPQAMRPDKPLTVIDSRPDQILTAAAWAGLAGLCLAVGWHRGWGLASRRKARPLARARRRIDRARLAETAAYETALIALHRGLDESFGHRLMADGLTSHIARRPAFAALAEPLGAFFEASRRLFFFQDEAGARHILPPEALRKLARDLARAERNG